MPENCLGLGILSGFTQVHRHEYNRGHQTETIGGMVARHMIKVVKISDHRRKKAPPVYFSRIELNQLLSLYSRRVISGEWKDYAIDHGRGMSAFSIYRDSKAHSAFTIYKYESGSHRSGDYVLGTGGNVVKRGRTLLEVLAPIERELRLVSR
ncbi:MAG: hypothetical protein ACI9MJ_000933 [Alphaproteobacteria bacterium]|jgi:hypothetical protein